MILNKAQTHKKGLSATVLKAMGLFTGVQSVNIVCSIVRTKFAALLLGPEGVGLFGLYNSTIDMMKSLSELGLRSSTIPSIASSKSMAMVARICYVVRRWNWVVGAIGAIITALLAPLLSKLTFDDASHAWAFVALSVSVFMASVTSAELSIIQGLGKLKRMAKASVAGSIAGLMISIPLFYLLGIRSIVPTILAYTVVTMSATLMLRERLPKPEPLPSTGDTFREGLAFVKLGICMAASYTVAFAASYVVKAWLNYHQGTDVVGIFESGYMLANRYIGLVFAAIGVEYFPRLSRVKDSPLRISLFVGHEASIAAIVILPVAALFIALDDVVIRLLYDSKFLDAAPFITVALVSTPFRALSWCMAFVMLTRGDGKIFLLTDTISATLSVVLFIAGYHIGGFLGMGVAYMIWYASYAIIVYVVYRRYYGLKLSRGVMKLYALVTVMLLICSLLKINGLQWPSIVIGVFAAIYTFCFMRRELSRGKKFR